MFQAAANPISRPAWVRYSAAIGLAVIAVVTRMAFTPAIGPTALPFITFFPAVALATWFGRLKPGLLCVILSVIGADWLFVEPLYSLRIASGSTAVALLAFLFSSGVILAAIETMYAARARITSEVEQRQRVQAALAVTLSSIGDGVIATDAIGCITFLNPEAERLTGWTEHEAKGKPLPEVFRIFNERTRKPTENPVEQALRSGKVIGLANHTILVAKDGTEVPIDDSAAPIRQHDGSIIGVVLVFRDVTKERRAQEAKARLAAIVEFSGDVVLSKDLNGVIQTWNASAQRLFGYSAEEVVGKPVTMLIPQDRLKEEDFILGRLRQGRPVERLETVRVTKSGKQIPIALSVSPIRAEDGELIGASKVIHDITDLVAAREALVREKELLATTLASIGDAVVVTNAEGRVNFLNTEAERLMGWKNAEAAGRPLPDVFHIINEHTRAAVENPVEKVIRLGKVVGLANHTLLIARDGTETPIGDSAAPIRQSGGGLAGVVLVFRDVAEEHKAYEAKSRLAAIVEHSGDVIFTKDLNGMIQTWNASAQRLFGYSAEEIVGKPVTLLIPPERLSEESFILDRLRHGQPVERLETVRIAKDGRRIPVALTVSPLRSPEGELIGASKVIHDITELVAAREALVREKELLATTLASIGDAVAVTDAQGRVTFLNAEAEKLTGWKNAEAAGRLLPEVFRIVNEETRAPVENPVEKVIRLGRVVGMANHTVLIARDGRETPIDDSAAPIREAGGPMSGVVLVFRDATQERLAHATLREREAELAAIINRTPFMLARCTAELRYRFVSRAYAEMLQRSPTDIVGQPIVEIVGEEAFKATLPQIEKVLQGERQEVEAEFHFKGIGTRYLHVVQTPEKGSSGETIGWLSSVLDITERRKAEDALREAHEQLHSRAVHLERLVQQRTARLNEMIGDLEAFSYSIVHDMRAPLRAMQGFAQLLAEECAGLSPDAVDYVGRIKNGAQRMDRLIQDGLSYSRMMRADLPLTPVDVTALISGMIDTYPEFQRPNVDIELQGAFPAVNGNEAGLTQCISNLLGNAIKFHAPDVRPQVRIWAETRNGQVRLLFKDKGIGIPSEAHERIFEIFHRLDPKFPGTGIGLAIVKKAAERMGGKVGVMSTPGEGSTFWLELAKASGSPANGNSHSEAPVAK